MPFFTSSSIRSSAPFKLFRAVLSATSFAHLRPERQGICALGHPTMGSSCWSLIWSVRLRQEKNGSVGRGAGSCYFTTFSEDFVSTPILRLPAWNIFVVSLKIHAVEPYRTMKTCSTLFVDGAENEKPVEAPADCCSISLTRTRAAERAFFCPAVFFTSRSEA